MGLRLITRLRKRISTANIDSGAPSASTSTLGKNDTLTQILGPHNPGRLRAMGRGMSTTKLACYQVKSAYMNQMQDILRMNNPCVNKSVPPKCLLVDWTGTEEIVAEGRLLSTDPEEYVNEILLRPNTMKVLVESAIIPNAFLWRPTTKMTTMEEAIGHIIAWEADSCVAGHEKVSDDEAVPKSPYVSSKNRCTLMDWVTGENHVAEGLWQSRDPQAMVNGIPSDQLL
ncbi:PREDICTED: uncharacterized protein LOC104732598 [Camelina sativa]|uniref:Uncharacterized protein LOC104732598 n=1 Tax=Camelina sativa TaxID=90675 RepID=A0ABM1QSK4_CAMSA|nr:PREDICTED: uncharacterized protein LOC104732598 [Camelina sativa]XP_019089742.1 PREDICTED: uncharacterized protein LOC104732598 [Camelina sativa]XP_019089743.1 PREDICTED: uncharacterized protein LOC104732598 [Camelina sativa]